MAEPTDLILPLLREFRERSGTAARFEAIERRLAALEVSQQNILDEFESRRRWMTGLVERLSGQAGKPPEARL